MRRALVGTVSSLAFGALAQLASCSTFSSDADTAAADSGVAVDVVVVVPDSASAPDVATGCVCDDGKSTLDTCTLQ